MKRLMLTLLLLPTLAAAGEPPELTRLKTEQADLVRSNSAYDCLNALNDAKSALTINALRSRKLLKTLEDDKRAAEQSFNECIRQANEVHDAAVALIKENAK